MIEQTVYLAGLFAGSDMLPRAVHFGCAALPPLVIALAVYKANKHLAAVGFATLHVLFYAALAKLTSGGYTYLLYTLTARLTGGGGYADMVAPNLTDMLVLFGLPAALHGLVVSGLGLAVARALRRRRG